MNPPAFLLASIPAMVILHFAWPVARLIPSPWNGVGVPFIAFGVVWNIWADRLFKRARTTVKPDQRPAVLVCEGPYRWSRHPMYLGMIAIVAGVAASLGTVSPAIILPAFTALLAFKFVPAEEKQMEQTFGKDWQQYKRRVRKWI